MAALRGATDAEIQALVDQYTEGRWLGVLGEPRVNVLELNLALDQRSRCQQCVSLQRCILNHA